MTQFGLLYPIILHNEGVSDTNPTGLVTIPGDPGGTTNWGISQREWSLLRVKNAAFAAFPADVTQLDADQAQTIYQVGYYLDVFDKLPAGPALIAFDCEVNEGIAVKIIQRAVNVPDDGQYGPQTDQAVRLALRDVPQFIENLCWQRLAHYASISKPDDATANRKFLPVLWIPRLIYTRLVALRQ